MATKKSNAGFYILLGTLVLGGAAAAYFFYFKPKMDEKKKEAEPLPEQDNANQPQPTPQPSTDSSLMETPFKNEGQGDAFRAWVNKFYPAYAKSIDLDITGKTNTTAIKKAWTKYGNEYIKGNPDWEKYTGSIGSLGVPDKLKLFIERKVGELKQKPEDKSYYVLVNAKTPKGTPYSIRFSENGGFAAFTKDKNWFYGGFSDGGRSIKVNKDNYKDIYKTKDLAGKSFKGETLFKTFDQLFPTK